MGLDIKEKATRNFVYKEILKLYDNPKFKERGLCHSIETVYTKDNNIPPHSIFHLDELYAYRPPLNKRYNRMGELCKNTIGPYWFPLSHKESRMELLKRAIKDSE